MTDGRNINSSLGTLVGEGSHQKVSKELVPWQEPDTAMDVVTPDEPTYYNRPVLKKPVWAWSIPAYYYVGGATGGAMVLGAAATLLNRRKLSGLVRQSRVIGVVGGAVSALLLIIDLGRPERFLYMLRVFRPTSPMSMGTWILVTFSGFTGLAALAEFGPKWLRLWGDLSAMAAGVLGLALAGYTGVLVSNTAVPLWQRPHRLMPPFFLSSGVTAAASVFDILGGNNLERRAVSIFGLAGKLCEVVCAHLVEKSLATIPEVARPLREGPSGLVWKAAKVLTIASLVVGLMPHASKGSRRLAGILGSLGSLCLRFSVHYAGNRSALNPRATFRQQRSGQGAYAATGVAAITGPGNTRAYSE